MSVKISYDQAAQVASFMQTYQQFLITLAQCSSYGANLLNIITAIQGNSFYTSLLSTDQQNDILAIQTASQGAISLINPILNPPTSSTSSQ